MEYRLANKKEKVNLTDRHYVGEGGEGKLYKDGVFAYKIYFDPTKAIPIGKIKELSVLNAPNIIRPIDVLLDKTNNYIGYMMNFVNNSVPLCKLFTNAYRDQNKIEPKQTVELVKAIQDTLDFIHKNGCLIVDGNEFNYLVDTKTHTIPYFIDTDSWQTPSFPATAILPSIRDLHTPNFNELTDWFSFGIIACQLFVGIHPYKGSHPSFKKNDLEGRMRANISIFNKEVTVPSAVRDFSYIPNEYQKWFIDVFDKGLRLPPPHAAAIVQIRVTKKTLSVPLVFQISELFSLPADIVDTFYLGNDALFIKTNNGDIFINHKPIVTKSDDFRTIRVEETVEPLFVKTYLHNLTIETTTNKTLVGQANASEITTYDDIIMARTLPDTVTLYTVRNGTQNKLLLLPHNNAQVLPNATKFYDGCLYMDALGKPYLYLPFKNNSGVVCCAMTYVKELEGYRILDAKHDNKVVMVIASQNNKYCKFVFRFDDNYKNYDCRVIDDILFEHPNFVSIPSGVVVHIKEDGFVEIFTNKIGSCVNVIQDAGITTTMKLFKYGARVGFYHNNKIYSISNK